MFRLKIRSNQEQMHSNQARVSDFAARMLAYLTAGEALKRKRAAFRQESGAAMTAGEIDS
jgi:hypothetical protein